MNQKEIERKLESQGDNWLKLTEDLDGLDFGGKKLDSILFSNCSLKGANFKGSTLEVVQFDECKLERTNFNGATLKSVGLSSCSIEDANFCGATINIEALYKLNLKGVNLTGSTLTCGDYQFKYDHLPAIVNLHTKISQVISQPGNGFSMRGWQIRETTHCRAGWAIVLAELSEDPIMRINNPELLGALLYHKAYPHEVTPNFYTSDLDALRNIQDCAKREKEGA